MTENFLSMLGGKWVKDLDVIEIIHEDIMFTTSVYRKPPLVEFMHILKVFYHLPRSLVLFTHLLIDACKFALVGLNYTMN